METANVKLLGTSASPYVNRIQFALNLKLIKYQFIMEEKPAEKSHLLIQSNPIHKKIPVFFHEDKAICESLVILEYIDETWTNGPPILPSDPSGRALARFWATYIDDKLLPLLGELGKVLGDEKARRAVLDKMIEALILLEDVFVECSKGKAFFGGDNIGYLDICLGCILGWLKVISARTNVKVLDETKTPSLVRWAERFCSDCSVKGVMPGQSQE